jgi:hypothetical protein
MKSIISGKGLLLFLFTFLSFSVFAQVKIGGDPTKDPHPSAVLELAGQDRGLLLPRLTQQQMHAVKDPANALVVYNTDAKAIFIYSSEQKTWMPLMQQVTERLDGDSCEWEFDTTTARVFLVRAYPLGDSIFYSTDSRKFVFSDRTENTNSLGTDFPVTSFPGKFYFKATASRFTDSSNLNPTMLNAIFEVDSSGSNTVFRGMQIATVNNPKNLQTLDFLSSLQLSTIHAGRDSLLSLTGSTNAVTVNGEGFTSSLIGFSNSSRIAENATNNINTVSGIRNSISTGSSITKVNGNVFGYFGSAVLLDSAGAPMVNGNLYGVFLSNISGAAPKRNYAYYSNKGHNRFGDSTVITDGSSTSPRAVLDINSTSAMITPAGTTGQRPAVPVTAMLRFNSTGVNMEYYNGSSWKAFSADTAEWRFDNVAKRVYLQRALAVPDTVFYSPDTRKFVFSDRFTNTNSLGQDFPVDAFNGKYTFKGTASQKTDSSLLNGSVVNMVYEIDNASGGNLHNTLSTSAVVNPKAFQKTDQVSGISNNTIHAGNDSVQLVIGILNTARNSGNGRSGNITGIQNNVRIQNGSANNTGEMIGFRNLLSRSGATAGRVTGNVYGYQGIFSGFTNNVDGNIYGIFLNSVTGAAPKKNYAFYSGKGHNRLGDSTLITDGASISPRAVLDINATSAMIVPTGTTAQRPLAPVQGMLRYNTTSQGLEAYSGTLWSGIVKGTSVIDIPNMGNNSGSNITVTVTGATTGAAVVISPTSALPGGVIIAWARVSIANTVEIRFENNGAGAVDPPSQTFNIRVIQ